MLKGHFWYRESTQEWVFEIDFQIEGYITSITRYPGKTKMDALKEFQSSFMEVFSDDLKSLEEMGMYWDS